MKKYLPHPLLIVCVGFCVAIGRWREVLCAAAALIVHELGHYVAARRRGFVLNKFSLTPFGATMGFDTGLSASDELFVAAIGPVCNLVACPLLVASWWVYPPLFVATKPLFYAHFLLALYNFLPVFPFDGGRILLALVADKQKAYRVEHILGYVLSGALFAAGILAFSCGYGGIGAIFAASTMFFCTAFPSENERYKLIFDGILLTPTEPLERRDVYCAATVRVGKLLRKTNRKNVLYIVHVLLPSPAAEDTKNPATKLFGAGKNLTLYGERLRALYFKDRRLRLVDVLPSL